MSDPSLAGDPELTEHWQRCGEWLSARFESVRVNSRNHLVVPGLGRTVFMLGFDRTSHGVIADLHLPFLVQVPEDAQLLEMVALNRFTAEVIGIDVFGSVRIVPEEPGSCSLELQHSVPAAHLDQRSLNWHLETLVASANGLYETLRPAFGGNPLEI
jgi:hypothetical protein